MMRLGGESGGYSVTMWSSAGVRRRLCCCFIMMAWRLTALRVHYCVCVYAGVCAAVHGAWVCVCVSA